ncbi:hypothetical protein COO04_09270 [Bacillus toyonensis]|uniref:hypothetical protein n=1 Tax=Bacillus cereus group TaxID=86661 RepID=UPI000BED2E37|nr:MULTISPECIES: hypothetical protein [Bacillus cereus group]PEG16424.1 hypothetical protein COO04_09270 [Bacillus toyonensis]PFL40525.1 hypothetical protein COJ06_10515 [Bacillus cereus]
MSIICANVKILGTRPLLFNRFTEDAIPITKQEKCGVPGNNPEEWKKTFQATQQGQLYLDPIYIFSCLRAGGKFISKGRGTLEPEVASTLQVLDNKIFINRFLPPINKLTRDDKSDVYIDVRPVSRRGVKNIRYRLAISSGWETEFSIIWEGTLISREQMRAICQDAGAYAGLGDARKVGFGRFHVTDFNIIQQKAYA